MTRVGIKWIAVAVVGAVALMALLAGYDARPASADAQSVSVIDGFGSTSGVGTVRVRAEDDSATESTAEDVKVTVPTGFTFRDPVPGATAPAIALCPDAATPCTGVTGAGTTTLTIPDTGNNVSSILVAPDMSGICVPASCGLQEIVPGNMVVKATQEGVTKTATLDIADQPDTVELTTDPATCIVQVGGGSLGEADLVATVKTGSDLVEDGVEVDWGLSGLDDPGTLDVALSTTDDDGAADDGGTAENEYVTGEDDGTATITATVEGSVAGGDGSTNKISDSADCDVVLGPHDVVIAVTPSELECTAATTVEITADVTDEDGNAVIAGNRVSFRATPSDQVLVSPGAAATEEDGTALADLNFVTGTFIGTSAVIVEASVERADGTDAVDTATVTCTTVPGVQPTATPGLAPTPVPTIIPPPTGSGGYLPQDGSGGLSWLALTGMSLGGLLLSLGGLAARRLMR